MIQKLALIFSFIFAFFKSVSCNDPVVANLAAQWNFEVAGSPNNNITLAPGMYYDFQFVVTNNDTTSLPAASTQININSTVVKLAQTYSIDPRDPATLNFQLGVPCDTTAGVYKVNVTTNNTDDFVFPELTVNVVADTVGTVVSPVVTLAPGSYAVYKVELSKPNVDSFIYRLNESDSEVTVLRDPVVQATSFMAYVSYNGTTTLNETKSFVMAQPNSCYNVSPLELNLNGTVPVINSTDGEKVKESLVVEMDFDSADRSITLNMNIPFAPVLMSCALATKEAGLPDYEMIRNHEATFATPSCGQLAQKFISVPTNETLKFSKLKRGATYQYICYFDTAMIEKTNQTSTSVSGDVKTPNPPSTICGKWWFDQEYTAEIEEKLVNSCQEAYGSSNSGCIQCQGPMTVGNNDTFPGSCKNSNFRFLESDKEEQILRVCAVANPECDTFLKDTLTPFKKFFETVDDTESLNQTLNLGNSTIKVDKTMILTDIVAPDASLVDTKIDEVTNTTVTFRTKYQKGEYECYALVSEKDASEFTFDDLNKNVSTYSRPGYHNDRYTLEYEPGFNMSVSYNIILGCYNIPNSSYHYLESDLVVTKTFKYDGKHKHGGKDKCDKKQDPLCDKKDKKLPDMKKNPKKSNSKEIEKFKNKTSDEKKAYLEENVRNISNINSTVDKLQSVILITDLVGATNCSIAEDPKECKKALKEVQKELVENLKENMDCEKLILTLNDTYNATSSPEDNIKLSLISIFGLTANIDDLDNNSTTSVAKMAKCFYKDAKDLFKIIEKTVGEGSLDSKKDIIKLLVSISSNLVDVLSSNEIDSGVTTNSTSQLIVNEQTKTIRDNIAANIPLLLQYGNETESAENFGFLKKPVTKSAPARFLQSSIDANSSIKYFPVKYNRDDVNFTIHLPNDYLITFNKNIVNMAGIVYDHYPLLAYGNRNFSEKVIGLKFYDPQANPIAISNLAHPIMIDFPPHPENFTHCVFFNETLNDWSNNGVNTTVLADGTIRCSVTHLTDFTIGNVDFGSITEDNSNDTLLVVLIVVGTAILVAVIIFLVCYCKKKKNTNSDILINEGGNKDIQMKKI